MKPVTVTIEITKKDLIIQEWLNKKINNPLIKIDHDDFIDRIRNSLSESTPEPTTPNAGP